MTESELGARIKKLGVMPGVRGVAMDLHQAPVRVKLGFKDTASKYDRVAAVEAAMKLEADLVRDAEQLKAENEKRKACSPPTLRRPANR